MKINFKIMSSLRNRIFFLFMACFSFIMILIFIVIYRSSGKSFSDMAISSTRRELGAITDNLESTLSHLFDYSISVSTNETIINITKQHPTLSESDMEQYEVRKTLTSIAGKIIGTEKHVKMWDIMALSGRFFKVGGYDLTYLKGFQPETIRKVHEDSLGPAITGPYYYRMNKNVPEENAQLVYVISKPIVDLNTREIYGYVVFFIEDSTLSTPFSKYMPENNDASFYILDSENQILLASDKTQIGTSALQYLSEGQLSALTQKRYLVRSSSDEDSRMNLVYCYTKMDSPDWQLIYLLPLKEFMYVWRLFVRTVVLLIAVICGLFLFMSWIIANSVTRPLLKLSNIMKNVVQNAYATTPIPKSTEEIQILYKHYNSMAEQTSNLLQTIYEEQRLKNDYQFKMIQAQIKPHFLYNTLEMIKSMIDLEMPDEASEAIIALSGFYRSSLSKGSDIITLQAEADIADKYMRIEKLRHVEYFDYQISIDSAIGHYIIPKLTLQPILENAILHGVLETGSLSLISVTIVQDGDHILLTVKDNGKGMDEATLRRLRNDLENTQSTPASFGLSSINRRLRLLYGKEYYFKINSIYGTGTTVTLCIPKVLSAKNESYNTLSSKVLGGMEHE